jgi:S1-C subfamily serine protease
MNGNTGNAAAVRSYTLAFVLGFGACAGTVRLLFPTPVEATSRVTFETADPAEVVRAVGATVVSLESYRGRPPAADMWRGIFGGAALENTGPSAVASGVILTADGYIVTNHHVVTDAGRIRARLADGREYDVRVVGSDPDSDLAVLKAPARNLQAARVADSRRVRAGEPVVAIGNPLGFENSVSVGVVSANRKGPIRVDGAVLGDMIQTDAAINQGNSGGGLFTADGRLLGVNSAIMVPRGGGGNIGIGFAIPAHRVRPVTKALIAGRDVRRPWLGIRYDLPSVSSLVRRLRRGAGVMVEDVIPGSPAANAGIRPSDVVRQLGASRIRNADDLFSFIERHEPGEKVEARLLRNGAETEVTLTLGEKPSE